MQIKLKNQEVFDLLTIDEFVSGLKCEKVEVGDKTILHILDSFNCGDPSKKGFCVSQAMLERLRKYILQDPNTPQIHDLYYIVYDANDVYLFFSLQSSLVFSTQQVSPEHIRQLKCAYDSAMDLDQTGFKENPEIDDFRNAMEMFDGFEFLGLEKYRRMNDDELRPIIQMISTIISIKKNEKQNNLYVDQIIPSIELVNFCKNHASERKWIESGFKPALVPTLFWYIILPIIFEVSQKIGCVYVALFAADASDEETDGKRTLLHYYENAYSFVEDENLCAVKPYYDWPCCFLCQKISVLNQKANQFKQLYLSEPTEDDV